MATEDVIKKESGQFDVESVFVINLSNRGLDSVGALPLCTQLCILDLSRNKLSTLSTLSVCTRLEWLDASSNQIAVLDGLDKMECLHTLNLADNCITSLDSLLPLASLHCLRKLTLIDHTCPPLTNPVCNEPSYSEFRLSPRNIIPSLEWLDNEMVCGQFHSKVRDLTGKWEVGEGEAIVTDHSGGKLARMKDPFDGFTLDDHMTLGSGHMISEEISGVLSQCERDRVKIDQEIMSLKKQLEETSKLN